MLKELTATNFDAEIENNPMVLILFGAPWCGPCRHFNLIYSELAKKHEEIVFAYIDIDVEQKLAKDFNVTNIPHLLLIREKIVTYSEARVLEPQELEQLISDAKSLDLALVKQQISKHEQQAQASKDN